MAPRLQTGTRLLVATLAASLAMALLPSREDLLVHLELQTRGAGAVKSRSPAPPQHRAGARLGGVVYEVLDLWAGASARG